MACGTGVPASLRGKAGAFWKELAGSLGGVKRADAPYVRIREPGDGGDIASGMDLPAVAAEIFGNISAVAEEKHDVAKIARVLETERVPEFVQTGKINDAVSQKIVGCGEPRDFRAESLHVGADEDNGSALAVHQQRLGLAIFAAAGLGPLKSNQRRRFCCGFETQTLSGGALPGLKGPQRKLAVAGAITVAGLTFGNEVGDRLLRVQRPPGAELQCAGSSRAQRQDNEDGQRSERGRERGHSQGIAFRRHFLPSPVCRSVAKSPSMQGMQSSDPDLRFLRAAYEQALDSYNQGGLPIGAAMVENSALIAVGHNRRVQDGDPIAHGEMDCFRKAGRRARYDGVTLYTTLSPCMMCAGTVLQFGVKRVVVGENRNFPGNIEFLRSHGVEVRLMDDADCSALMQRFIAERPELWDEDIAGRSGMKTK